MPNITDENGTKLKPLGEFTNLGPDGLRCIIDFCMPRALFSIRRASSAFLNLPTNDNEQMPYIEKCLLKTCVSDVLCDTSLSDKLPEQAHQWISNSLGGVLPFTVIQEVAFSSPHALANYSVAQRISLTWTYSENFIGEVLNTNYGGIIRKNISYMMDYDYDCYNEDEKKAIRMCDDRDLVTLKLASLGVTQAEFNKIPLQIRLLIMLNQIFLDRKEIDYIIDEKNKAIFLSTNLINSIKQLIAISPMQYDFFNDSYECESKGNLIKPKLSRLCNLYKQGGNRVDFLFVWLKNRLQNLSIYQDINMYSIIDLLSSDCLTSDDIEASKADVNINQELDSIIDLLSSDYLTSDDIENSKANGYDLFILQTKIDLETAKKEAANRENTALLFSSIVDSNVSTSSVEQPTGEIKTITLKR